MCATHSTVHEHGNEWDGLDHGIHVCSLYRNKDEQFSPIIPFFSEGFKKRERCVYVFEENSPEEISAVIHRAEADPAHLETLSPEQIYIKEGSFDPDTVVTLLKDKIKNVRTEGYSGMRAATEMTWVLKTNTPTEKLIEYEQKLNTFYPTEKITGVCQYNETKFSPEFLIDIIRAHPYIIVRGKLYKNNYFYTEPEYTSRSLNKFRPEDYETIISIITDEEPIA